MAACQEGYCQPNFQPGSIVQCMTCLDDTVKGEVIAFDYPSKLLALKTSVGGGKSKIQFVNLELVRDISIIKEQTGQQGQTNLPHLNFNLIDRRNHEEIERRRRSVCSATVSSEGQRIFVAIRKTIDDVCWEGDKIVVFGRAVVQPPYRCEDVQIKINLGCTESDAENTAQHVRKIIDKFWTNNNNANDGIEKRSLVISSS